MPCNRPVLSLTALLILGQACVAHAQPTLNLAGQAQVDFSATSIHELSGITFLGGDSYLLVSDTGGNMHPSTIVVDRSTGFITSSSLGSAVAISGGSDLEGIAYDPRDGGVLISDESGQTISRHNASTGALDSAFTVPTIFGNSRGNLGLESLSLAPVAYNAWTANEESLTVDGPVSTDTTGTLVRLQRFDSTGTADAQFGYQTEPHAGDDNILSRAQSGVSDLLALPDGGLIVMERELGGSGIPSFRNRLYLIDSSAADDTSSEASLKTPGIDLVGKDLLLQVDAGLANFEGLTLGPMLENGDYAVLLIADDGGSGSFNPQNLLALRLSGIAVDGDLTGDFLVDQADLDVVLDGLGDNVAAGNRLLGDFDGDGVIGQPDVDEVLDNWTGDQPPSIPEPGSLCMLGGMAWTIMMRH